MKMQLYETLFESVYSNNINQFFETIHFILGNPVTLVDIKYNVIGLLPKEKLNDCLWDSMLENNIVTYDMVLELSRGDYQTDLDKSNGQLLIDYGIGKTIPRICVACKIDNKVLGYLCVLFTNTPYDNDSFEIIKLISKAASILLLNNKNMNNLSYKQLDYFLESLFCGKLSTRKKIDNALAINNLKMKGNYLVIYTEINDGSNNIVYLEQMKNYIASKITSVHCCIINRSLYILCYNIKDTSSQEYEKSINTILSLVSNFKFKIGFSTVFNDLLDINLYCNQAKFAFKISNDRNLSHIHYDNVIVTDIFQCAQDKIIERYVKNTTLLKLKDYDNINQTEYYDTLRVYILNFCNTAKVASKLNIHRNTLLYRLNKIKELTQYDFNNSDLCIRLLCDFLIEN